MKVYGFLEKAQLENVSADLSNTLSGLIWYNTTDNKARFYDGAVRSIVSEDGTQTLTNKTLSGGNVNGGALISDVDIDLGTASDTNKIVVSKDTRTNLDGLTREAGSVYYSTDEAKYLGDDGLNLVEFGGGAGEGINYISNPDAETNADGHVAYKDSASEVPDDGTGGSPTLSVARSVTDPLFENASFVISKPASNVQGEGIKIASEDFDNGVKGSVVAIKINVDLSVANAQDGDFRVYFKDETNSNIIRVNNEDIFAKKGVHYAYVQIPTDCDNGSVIIHCAATHADAYDFKYDKVSIGPINAVSGGAFVSDWIDFTPTVTPFSGTMTNVIHYGKYRRVGDSIEAEVKSVFSAPSAVFSTPLYSLPSGLSFDGSKFADTPIESFIGTSVTVDGSVNTYAGEVRYWTDTQVLPNVHTSVGASTGTYYPITNVIPITFNAGDAINFRFKAPIQGWETGVKPNEVVSGRSFVAEGVSNAGTAITTAVTNIDFTTTRNDGGAFNGTEYTAPETGDYSIDGCAFFTTSALRAIAVYRDEGSGYVEYKRAGPTLTDSAFHFSTNVFLNKGDKIALRTAGAGGTLDNTIDTVHWVKIYKENNFSAQIQPTETVSVNVSTDSGQAITGGVVQAIVFEDTLEDTHNSWNNDTFTAPTSGRYFFNANMLTPNVNTSNGQQFLIRFSCSNGYTKDDVLRIDSTSTMFISHQGSAVIPMVAGDTVQVEVFTQPNTSLNPLTRQNTLSIVKVGN